MIIKFIFKRLNIQTASFIKHIKSIQLPAAVSYTHLDVYKRQEIYEAFTEKYKKANEKLGLKQFLVPYFISSHPGCTLEGAIELAVYLKKHGLRPRQVQDFYPTPGTLSTCMFYTGKNPLTGEKIFIPKSYEEKQTQRALMQYYKPENKEKVKAALIKAGRKDLIGTGKDCLIFEKKEYTQTKKQNNKYKKNSKYKSKNKSGKSKPNSRKRRYK